MAAEPSRSHTDEENPTAGDEQEIIVQQKGLSGMSMKDMVAQFGPTFEAYFYGTVATGIKTFAWWLNQWPFLNGWNYFAKWAISASVAGMEYLPLTMAMQLASKKGVHLGLMTAYMEAADNFLRMMQQLGLGDVLDWFDWVAAVALGVCVAWQGYKHYYSDQVVVRQASARKLPQPAAQVEEVEMEQPVPLPEASDAQANAEPVGSDQDRRNRRNFAITLIVIVAVVSIIGSAAGGATGQAYVLATVATAAKTFAWWINQYPQLQHLNFYQKWLAGWSIAALIEYLPLMGAFTIASENLVHLGLMTAYMEALDNFFRICQQKILGKPLAWYDLVAAAGMFVAVLFQGVMRYSYDRAAGQV